MIRFLLALLLALALATGAGPATAGGAADCEMSGASHQMPMDHEKMGCCTPDCAVTCPPAMLAAGEMHVGQPPSGNALRPTAPAEAFHSLDPAAVDPPPRTGCS